MTLVCSPPLQLWASPSRILEDVHPCQDLGTVAGGGGVTGCRYFYSKQLTTALLFLMRILKTNRLTKPHSADLLNDESQRRDRWQHAVWVSELPILLCNEPALVLSTWPVGRCLCPAHATVPSLHLVTDGTSICQLRVPRLGI